MKILLQVVSFSVLAVAATEVRAELLAYDGFAYQPVGAMVARQDGGFGFAGAWRPGGFNASLSTNYLVGSESLEFAPLLTSGNRLVTSWVSSIAGLTRDLAAPMGDPGTTRYLSYLVRPEGTVGQGAFNGFFGVLLEQPGNPEIFAGKPGGGQLDRYVLENRGGSAQVATDTTVEVDETVLMVLKSEFTSGADTFSLFMNPTPGGDEPANADAVRTGFVGQVQGVTVYSSGAFSLDEIRLGETFADVVPVPEPSAVVLLLSLLAVAAGLSLRRATR